MRLAPPRVCESASWFLGVGEIRKTKRRALRDLRFPDYFHSWFDSLALSYRCKQFQIRSLTTSACFGCFICLARSEKKHPLFRGKGALSGKDPLQPC